jgi:antitoxin PrlF
MCFLVSGLSKADRNATCCSPTKDDLKVEAIVTMDDRGQMLLPKEIREKAGLKGGDKLALVTREVDGKVCCLYLFKSHDLLGTVKEILGPLNEKMATGK